MTVAEAIAALENRFQALLRWASPEAAEVALFRSVMFNPTSRNISLVPPIIQNQLVEFHRNLLLDSVRTETYRRAIMRVVKPGDVVADIGAGTGVLSMFAAEAGAKRVYGIEGAAIAEYAREAIEANGLAERISIIYGHSSEVAIPEKVDVLVSECIGWMMYVGDMFAAVTDARDRFLRPGGIVIPQAIKLFAAPVQSAHHHRYAEFFRGGAPYGLNLSVFGKTDHVFVTTFDPECLVSDPVVVASCDVSVGYPNEVIDTTVEFAIRSDCLLHGFALWFEADLCPDVSFSSAPGKPITIWQQTYCSCGTEIAAKKGTTVVLGLQLVRSLKTFGQWMAWKVKILSSDVKDQVIERSFSTVKASEAYKSGWTSEIDGKRWLQLWRDRHISGNGARRNRWWTGLAELMRERGKNRDHGPVRTENSIR
jgi:precorrin-6B methylase 2